MAMPCIRCSKCVDVCPVDLLPQQLYWHARANNLEQVQQHNLFDCIECGCCSYVCPSNISLVSYYRHAKSAVKIATEKLQKTDQARERHEYREFRLQREKDERKAKLAKHKPPYKRKKQQKQRQIIKTSKVTHLISSKQRWNALKLKRQRHKKMLIHANDHVTQPTLPKYNNSKLIKQMQGEPARLKSKLLHSAIKILQPIQTKNRHYGIYH
jgi:electron transport complex protein RnfC